MKIKTSFDISLTSPSSRDFQDMVNLANALGLPYTRICEDALGLPYAKPEDNPYFEYFNPFPSFYEEGSPEMENLVREAKKLGIPLDVNFSFCEWSKEELESAQFLSLEIEGKAPCYPKVTYECKDICPECKCGAVQVGMATANNFVSALRKTKIHEGINIYIVSEELKERFEDELVTGITHLPVQDEKTGEIVKGFYQMVITNQIPPYPVQGVISHQENRLKCGTCHRVGRLLVDRFSPSDPSKSMRDGLHFAESDVQFACDFNRTYGFLTNPNGPPNVCYYTIVSQRVYRLFKKLRIKTAEFEPVTIHPDF